MNQTGILEGGDCGFIADIHHSEKLWIAHYLICNSRYKLRERIIYQILG